ncbi:heterokaryon incompatibility protein Het-C-domain-containing protein [Lophiotrema nucula]|uniref:Heterokaryon incompatibility protein Het-C-domain-containing protein n=1 Tax=Lophiotrema nucula TaxID=690887 RepID=A0A6A5Z156_9PLEO|nr:heterokaryon incompatibility protein Het-C-domain-containing protein [Lophiotrema nucula]
MPPPKLTAGHILLPCLVLLVFWARPTSAFGAGNIASLAKIEGQNWRHGDIEDTLLNLLMSSRTGKKFSKMDVKRVYFGNWLLLSTGDYSQAVDVGTVKSVSAEAIRILLWVLGFLSFGYGTKEFEVTRDRLGCYRPEEHIDNPKDYADNLDARQYDRRLRGPVDERRELSVDERTGLKNYIASEDLGITTSAGMVRDLFRRCVDLGRRANNGGPKSDLYEALRLLGTACHCLEDYSAHSNYTELVLIELGERDIFPHVGRQAQFRVQGARGPVYPIVTGTFGGVDFLHSVMGEFSDKATQSEIQELEGALEDSQNKKNKSMIKDLLNQLPDGIFGGKDQAGKADELEDNANAAQMGNLQVSPKEPEEFTQQVGEIVKQIYPIMEFHDEIMQQISEFIENIPVLPELIENLQEQVNIFVFSLLAPYVVPIINQVKTELETGSSEVIASSRDKQHIVFNDNHSTDPTHSMLSKDHFSNVLNEPAGRVASEVLKWVVPQIVQCWDDERADAERTIQRIITGVFNHPALRQYGDDGAADGRNIMFRTVESWWNELSSREKSDLRDKLSRDGVEQGRNHKPGVHDKGHGCGKPLGIASDFGGMGGGKGGNKQAQQISNQAGKMASEAVGGGALGGIVGGLVGGLGGGLLGGAFGEDEKKSKKSEGYSGDGSYQQSYSESGHHKKSSRDDSERYGQAQYSSAQSPGGGRREEYSRQEQDVHGGSYGYQQKVETSSYSGSGGYERHEERRFETGNQYESVDRREGFDQSGGYYKEEKKKHGKKNDSEEDTGDEDDYEKRRKKEQKKREKEEKKKNKKHGDYDNDSDDDAYKRRDSGDRDREYKRKSNEYKRKSQSPKRRGSGDYSGGRGGGYGGEERSSGGYGQERRYGEESGGYGGRQEYSGGRQEYSSSGGYGNDSNSSGGRQQESSYGGDSYSSGGAQYGRQQESYGGGGDSYNVPGSFGGGEDDEYQRQQQGGYGGGYGGGGDDSYERRY